MKNYSSKINFFIIPGFKQQATDENYAWLIKFLKKQKFNVIPVPVVWDYKTLSKNAHELEKFFEQYKNQENYLLGFSYGAVLAMLIFKFLKPQKLFLCSLSPDFLEDTKFISKEIRKYIGERRYFDTKTRSALRLASEINVPTTVFYGEKEGRDYPQLKKRCEETASLIPKAKLVVVKYSPHQIDFSNYREAIESELIVVN